ncbi:MAG TPA: hypothetical protein VMU84_00195, partial [Thermoanaerobaculia bacterium]|nr:hypothetical protein [Thermoanaerobaculia bacterium]
NNMRKRSAYRFSGQVLFSLDSGFVWRKDNGTPSSTPPDATEVAALQKWFATVGKSMSPGEVTIQAGSAFRREVHTLEGAVLWDCYLSFHAALDNASLDNGEWVGRRSRTVDALDLRDLDLASAEITEVEVPASEVRSKPIFNLTFGVTADHGDAVLVNAEHFAGEDQIRRSSRSKSLVVRIAEERFASDLADHVLKAGALCGASGNPAVKLATALPRETGSDSTSPTQSSAITNEDVTRMVKAGLSEVVVVAFINQSAQRRFKLDSSTLVDLKAAKVPDAVVAAMLAPPPAAPSAPALNDKPKSKYDPGLAAAANKAAVPPQLRACEGIELMGIYKNELISREMSQGGMEEWLAKIRNNTSLTKIIKFGWIDQYGGQQVAQVELRGGDIATPRLDLTQKRFIAPVKDLKLVSCQ